MDEADELASRIAIMVRVQLTCLGTPQYLKTNYSSRLILLFKVRDESALDNAVASFLEIFAGSEHDVEQLRGGTEGCAFILCPVCCLCLTSSRMLNLLMAFIVV